jgi:hypothetical protein
MADAHVDEIRQQFTRQAEVYARMRQTTDERYRAGLFVLRRP